MKTLAAVFPTLQEAANALHDLEQIGVPSQNISILAANDKANHERYLQKAKHAAATTESSAATGARIGGGLGLLAALVTLTVPGVGPMMIMGPLAMVIAGGGVGAAGGALIAAFHNMGIDHEKAPLYEEAVRRGAIMLIATVDGPLEPEAVSILRRRDGRYIRNEADTWEAAGWKKPDPHPYPMDDTLKVDDSEY